MTDEKKRPFWAVALIVLTVLFSIVQPEFLPITVPLIIVLIAIR